MLAWKRYCLIMKMEGPDLSWSVGDWWCFPRGCSWTWAPETRCPEHVAVIPDSSSDQLQIAEGHRCLLEQPWTSNNSPQWLCNFNIDLNGYFHCVVTFVEESFKEVSDVNGVHSGQHVMNSGLCLRLPGLCPGKLRSLNNGWWNNSSEGRKGLYFLIV